jgi:hypothetical protein
MSARLGIFMSTGFNRPDYVEGRSNRCLGEHSHARRLTRDRTTYCSLLERKISMDRSMNRHIVTAQPTPDAKQPIHSALPSWNCKIAFREARWIDTYYLLSPATTASFVN